MKRNLIFSGVLALIGLLNTSHVFSQETSETKAPKKSRHIKMIKIVDGKKMEIDTLVTGNDVFVWKGDTLNAAKRIGKFSPSEFDKLHRLDVEVENTDGKQNVRIHKHRIGKQIIMDMDSVEDSGDSTQTTIVIRKDGEDGDQENEMFHFEMPDMEHFPPMPPISACPHARIMMQPHSGRIIDLNDPNIISFRKKKLSGGREKIEIIRKKTEGLDDNGMSFNFDMEEPIMIPELPDFVEEPNPVEFEPKEAMQEK